MSTIGLKYHNEDIHCIIKKPMSPTIKSPRYVSKRKVCLKAEQKKYNGHQTFGLAHYEAPESKNFLRKAKQQAVPPATKLIMLMKNKQKDNVTHQRTKGKFSIKVVWSKQGKENFPFKCKLFQTRKFFPDKKEFKCTINCKSSPIPKPSFDRVKQTRKNFVKENIKKALALTPKVPVPRRVETPRGTSKDLAHLLQMIKIRESEEYGRIPQYLCERKKRLEKERKRQESERQAIKDYKEKMGIGTQGMAENVYMIDAETRKKILDGLKENWNELSKQFLKLPVMTDTWPKIKRKMCLENDIVQLEKDIRLVESHPYIYLERTDRRSYAQIAAEQLSQRNMQKQAVETEKEETEVKPETEKKPEEPKLEVPAEEVDEIYEDKKEEDTEINIHNY